MIIKCDRVKVAPGSVGGLKPTWKLGVDEQRGVRSMDCLFLMFELALSDLPNIQLKSLKGCKKTPTISHQLHASTRGIP